MDTCKRAYKKLGNQGLFDSEERTSMLSALGNPLERLAETVDFEMFRETLETGLYRERLTNAGAKPYDYVLMFKILVLQRMYNLSDEQAEYQIVDRTSFRDFLGLASGDKVPDARTIWAFKEQLTRKSLYDRLFADFDKFLREKNLIMNQGVIIDGSFVEVPRQRNTREENKAIKDGRGNELWNEEEGDSEEDKKKKANKKRHKDTDARWTKKGGQKYYGYKNHAKVDAKSKLIKKAVTTSAEQHDSIPTKLLIDNDDRGQELHADSAYIGKNVKSVMRKYQMKDRVIKRSVRGKKLSKKQETVNRKNSKTRVRVEHVFGYCELNLHGMFSRVIGFARNAARNTLTNLVYNVCRYEQIVRLGMN